jgi:hypothetical protein
MTSPWSPARLDPEQCRRSAEIAEALGESDLAKRMLDLAAAAEAARAPQMVIVLTDRSREAL